MELLEHARIFHCGVPVSDDEPARSATFHALKAAKEAGALISYDPNYRPLLWSSREAAEEQMRAVIPWVDIMKISDEETELLTGCADPEQAAGELIRQGVSCAVVTLGGEGALMRTKDFTVRGKGTGQTGGGYYGSRGFVLGRNSVQFCQFRAAAGGADSGTGQKIHSVCQCGGRTLRGAQRRYPGYASLEEVKGEL